MFSSPQTCSGIQLHMVEVYLPELLGVGAGLVGMLYWCRVLYWSLSVYHSHLLYCAQYSIGHCQCIILISSTVHSTLLVIVSVSFSSPLLCTVLYWSLSVYHSHLLYCTQYSIGHCQCHLLLLYSQIPADCSLCLLQPCCHLLANTRE